MKQKKFNITGLCIPGKHYMVDTSTKIEAIMEMVEDGSYFVINRPRQYGKTTTISLLRRCLQEHPDFLPLSISFEAIDTESYTSVDRFLAALFWQFRKIFRMQPNAKLLPLVERGEHMSTLPQLDEWISEFVMASPLPIVLMIDEVDKSSNHQLFLDFLAMLRTKYLAAADGTDATFHSIILAGVHDIKSLKMKLRPDDGRKYNSPWNIAVDFTVDLSFQPADIETMLADYGTTNGVEMNQGQIAERLYYYSSGYPFLVSALCKIIDEDLKRHHVWQLEDVDLAVHQILAASNTNFDHLIKNLENYAELATLVERLLLAGEFVPFNQDNPLIYLGVQYGILAKRNNTLAIHNRIYQERIYNYLTSVLETGPLLSPSLGNYTFQAQFVNAEGKLDLTRVLLKFQEFMKQEYSQREETFLERNGRLVFFAFLRPILNGQGFAFKESQISEEKRLDVIVTFGSQRHIIELKIWRGEGYHKAGLKQLADYLERTDHEQGSLVIFDFTQKGQKRWKQEHIQIQSKEIFAVWV